MSGQPEYEQKTERLVDKEPDVQMGQMGMGTGAKLPQPVPFVAGEERPKRRKGLTCAIVAVVVVLLVICAAVVVWVVVPALTGKQIIPAIPGLSDLLSPSRDQILLAFPSRRGDVELYLLKLGQDEDEGTLLAEDAEEALLVDFWLLEEGKYQSRVLGDYGSFVPDSDRLLLWYRLEDEIVIQQMRVGDEEPTEVMDSKADVLLGAVFDESEIVFLRETRDGQARCYVAMPGGEAERLAKVDACYISLDGSTIIFSEVDEGATTLSAVDTNGENETVLLDEVEGVGSPYLISGDGSHLAYVQVEGKESQLYRVERDSGEEVEVSGEVLRIVDYGFALGSDTLFYIAEELEDDFGVLRLYVSDSGDPIAAGPVLGAYFAPDGQHLVYLLSDEDGEETLYVHPMGGGGDVKVLTGEDIRYSILETSPPRVLALSTEENEFTLYSAGVDGGDVVELLSEEDVTFEATYVQHESLLYIQITDEDGEVSLFVAPLGGEDEGYTLLEEWASIEILNSSPDGSQLVLWAREDWGDDPVLYSIAVEDGADPVELDDDSEGFRNAVFTSDGRFVLYTAVTGDESDDVEVHQVQADGEEKYEILYEEALLADVRWDDIVPWYVPLHWRTAEGAQFASVSRIVFVSDRDDNNEIYVMAVPDGADADESEVVRLTDNWINDSTPIWSPDGQRIAFASGDFGEREIYVVNADGSELVNLTDHWADDGSPVWSPDGQRIAFQSDREGNDEIYVMNADGSGVVRLTENSADDWHPVWSPDGQRIAFRSDRDHYNMEIYVMDADGSNVARLTDNEMREFSPHWSSDGRYIAFSGDEFGTYEEIDLFLMEASCIDRPEECEDSVVQLTEEQGWNWFVDWSPDGERILFASDREDDMEVYVMDTDGRNVTQLTDSGDGSAWPIGWSANGKFIVFESDRDGDDEIYVMDADGGNVVQLTDNEAGDWGGDLWP